MRHYTRGPLELTHEESLRHQRTWDEAPRSFASGQQRLRIFELALWPPWRGWVFFLAAGGLAAFLGGEVLRAVYVAQLGESVDPRTLQKALVLDPANSELHHRLGMVLYDSSAEADRSEGLKQLRRATELNQIGRAH